MLKKTSLHLILLSLLLIPLGCSGGQQATQEEGADTTPAENVELMVSAAASLTDALNELQEHYEEEHEGVTLRYNFGSSGKLATQIEQGAPSDVFLSASKIDMDRLEKQDLIQGDTRVDFTKNVLVLITNKDNPTDIASFEEIDPEALTHLAIGEPESVPVGRYTKQLFDNLDKWELLQSRLVLGSDVRQVLTFVESGNAEAGVIYSSDASISDKVAVLAQANGELHDPIVYPGALIAETDHSQEAKAFMTLLTGEKGKKILSKYGFK